MVLFELKDVIVKNIGGEGYCLMWCSKVMLFIVGMCIFVRMMLILICFSIERYFVLLVVLVIIEMLLVVLK